MDYLAFGHDLITQNPGLRTIRGQAEGQDVWIKRQVPAKTKIWHKIQHAVASCLPFPIIRATVCTGGGDALKAEAARMDLFRAKGFHTPVVLAINDEFMIITHLGPQLKHTLDHINDQMEKSQLLNHTARALAQLHQTGLVHGRPFLRDMTWDEHKIGFLDLEEDPLSVMPFRDAQVRDIWLFLGSCARHARRQDGSYDENMIRDVLNAYRAAAPSGFESQLKSFAGFLKWPEIFARRMLWNRIGKDVRQLIAANSALRHAQI